MRDQELVRRFLLEELEEKKAEHVEKRLLEDDELYELCEAVEAELLDAAARGELAPAERERVLKRLASSPEGRARLALAKSLAAIADGTMATEPMPAPLPFRQRPALAAQPVVRWAMAAGLATLLAATLFFLKTTGPGDQVQVAETVTVEESPRPGEVRIDPPTIVTPPANPNIGQPGGAPPPPPQHRDEIVQREELEPLPRDEVTPEIFVLSLLSLRDDREVEEIRISRSEHSQFHVDVTEASQYASYGAVVRRGDVEVLPKAVLKPVEKNGVLVLILDLYPRDLPAGRYDLEIYGNSAEEDPKLLMKQEFEVSGGG